MNDNYTLNHFIDKHFKQYLETDITEIAINRPHELFVREGPLWGERKAPDLSMTQLKNFAQIVATMHKQDVSESTPLLSATLSDGYRVQIVMPPAVPHDMFGLCIRKPISKSLTWDEYRDQGFFSHVASEEGDLTATEKKLLELKENFQYEEFLKYAVESRQNIVVSGATGSGKTTFTNLLIDTIPRHLRIATIEDAIELMLPHKNVLRLKYSKGGQGTAKVTPDDLLEACLRLTPHIIILSEIRGGETFSFINAISSGHDGCITSVHARNPQVAFQRMTMMFKQSETGKGFDEKTVDKLLRSQINIVVQINYDEKADKRYISSIYYDPYRQREAMESSAVKHFVNNAKESFSMAQ